jgi:hypothetical protein
MLGGIMGCPGIPPGYWGIGCIIGCCIIGIPGYIMPETGAPGIPYGL